MELPNIENVMKRFLATNNTGERYGIMNIVYGAVNTTAEGEAYGDITAPHLYGWWPQSLGDHLTNAGFRNIMFMPEQIPHPAVPEDNMRVECIKPLLQDTITASDVDWKTYTVAIPPAPEKQSQEWPSNELMFPQHKFVVDEIYNQNCYGIEPNELEGRTIFDVGANVGIFVKYALEHGAKRVVAIEANPIVFQELYKNFGTTPNVTIINAAVYDNSKQTVLLDDNGTLSRVSDEGSVSIQTITLNSLVKYCEPTEEILLKIDCEGSEYPILLNSLPDDIRRFKIIYAEFHGDETDNLVQYMHTLGYESSKIGAVIAGDKELARTIKFKHTGKIMEQSVSMPNNNDVTAYISTKDRYFSTLPLAISGIASQTVKPKRLVIYDDGAQEDLRKVSLYENLFKMLNMVGIDWEVIFGERKGQVANHQKALMTCKTPWLWRVDDDNYPEANVLETLLRVGNSATNVGAVATTVIVPAIGIFPSKDASGWINNIDSHANVQWTRFAGTQEVDHLHNTFLIRTAAGQHGYQMNLSPVGHREETLFTYKMKRHGWKLLVTGDATTWHHRDSAGGIRAFKDPSLWDADEKVFRQEMKNLGVLFDGKKYVVLDNGIGDHYAFKSMLDKMIAVYGKDTIVISSCFPEVFEDTGVNQISIAAAYQLFNIDELNIYRWMGLHNWNQNIISAYEALYL
jgi:FkbM family methyltransferase